LRWTLDDSARPNVHLLTSPILSQNPACSGNNLLYQITKKRMNPMTH
jgi:hypothetical protein